MAAKPSAKPNSSAKSTATVGGKPPGKPGATRKRAAPSGRVAATAESDGGGAARSAAQAREIHTINEQLSGPVLDIYRTLLPNLNSLTYTDILASPELVNGCLLIFEKQRALFATLLKDKDGQPVTTDDAPLWCGRSVEDVRVLVIRTTAKKYFRTHGDRFKDVSEHAKRADSKVNVSLLERLFDVVSRMWSGAPSAPARGGKPAANRHSGADRFYDTIAPLLRERWQVPLIPYYAALPRSLIEELGEGLLSMRRPEDLEFLLSIGRSNFNEAQQIAGDLAQEMLKTDPRATVGVSHAGTVEYERLLNGLYHTMGARFWKVFTGTELLDSLQHKTTADIVEMASHLDRMSPSTVDYLIAHLQRPQIAPFLRVAEQVLPAAEFDAIFGVPGDQRLAKVFAEKAAKIRLDPSDPDDFEKRLPFIFQAYKSSPGDFAKKL